MHIGKSYKLRDFIIWTRRKLYVLVILGIIPVVLYHVLGLKWLAVPWTVVSLLGTATAFIVGFKNTQTYSRTWDGHAVWTSISNASKTWGIVCRDYFEDPALTKRLIYRHFAWLTALRYQLRENRIWEVTDRSHNAEYLRYYTIPERLHDFTSEMLKFIPEEELKQLSAARDKPGQLIAMQSRDIREVFAKQAIVPAQFIELQRMLGGFYNLQGQCESLKDTPYPRQYAIISTIFVRMFVLLLPFGMLQEFDKLNDHITGIMSGHMIWLTVPFSVIISWMYTSLVQVGESTENPFEGSANDVPISQICRVIEIDLRGMLGEKDLPPEIMPQRDILI